MRLLLTCLAAISFLLGFAVCERGPVAQTLSGPGEGQKPIDNGPATPQSNSAYQGGGVVLQGAPGAPAPQPEPTPPGQTPTHALPK